MKPRAPGVLGDGRRGGAGPLRRPPPRRRAPYPNPVAGPPPPQSPRQDLQLRPPAVHTGTSTLSEPRDPNTGDLEFQTPKSKAGSSCPTSTWPHPASCPGPLTPAQLLPTASPGSTSGISPDLPPPLPVEPPALRAVALDPALGRLHGTGRGTVSSRPLLFSAHKEPAPQCPASPAAAHLCPPNAPSPPPPFPPSLPSPLPLTPAPDAAPRAPVTTASPGLEPSPRHCLSLAATDSSWCLSVLAPSTQ